MKYPTLSLLFLAIIIATLTLFSPVIEWFLLKMSLANGWFHIMAFAGLCGLGSYRLYKLEALPFHPARFSFWPTFLWVGTGIAFLLNESQIGFNTLSAALFFLFIYGLSGYFLQHLLWRSLFIPTSLLILVLPFEHYLDIYLGFPLRLLSAEWSATLLQYTGLPLLTTESILVIDNRAAIVDLDCSGVKSLWIGLIFYLLLTWIEHYRINWRWLLLALIYVLLLLIANVVRITILVLLELVLKQTEIAGIFHQPLGLVGFGMASVTIWWLLNHLAQTHDITPLPDKKKISLHNHKIGKFASPLKPTLISGITLISIVIMGLVYQPLTNIAEATTIKSLTLPAKYKLDTSTLNKQEEAFFSNNQAQAHKYSLSILINNKPVRVSMVLVWSRAWKAHHVPENCYLSQGFSMSDQGVWRVQDHALRYLQLSQPESDTNQHSSRHKTAVYWFQSIDKSTPDYSARVMDNFSHPGRNWVMASILFENTVTPEQISPFINTLKNAIKDEFHEIQ